MKDIFEVLFRIFSVLLLPLFVIGYGIYGIRVWAWNFVNRAALEGEWCFMIEHED